MCVKNNIAMCVKHMSTNNFCVEQVSNLRRQGTDSNNCKEYNFQHGFESDYNLLDWNRFLHILKNHRITDNFPQILK